MDLLERNNIAVSTALSTRRRRIDRAELLRRNLARRIRIENNHVSMKARQPAGGDDDRGDEDSQGEESNSEDEEHGHIVTQDSTGATVTVTSAEANSQTQLQKAVDGAHVERDHFTPGEIVAVVLGMSIIFP